MGVKQDALKELKAQLAQQLEMISELKRVQLGLEEKSEAMSDKAYIAKEDVRLADLNRYKIKCAIDALEILEENK